MSQRRQWIPTFSLFLFLYPAGWFISRILYLFNRDISSNNLSIIGTIITFFMFLFVLPGWGRTRWKTNHTWLSLGLDFRNKLRSLKIFCSGFIFSFFLLLTFCLFIFLCGWIDGFDNIKLGELLNAILLIVGIVFAEEIVFRGWLLQEMVLLFGLRRGIFVQSAIFSLAHYRSDIGFLALIPFLTGLFLFGLVLNLRRAIDQGSLWGCVGLHGGLVGTWYLLDSGMVIFSNETPYYLLGPSKYMVNPIASVFGIIILLTTIFFQRRLFASTGRFLTSTVNASFKDETP
ncbi:CPBP family intramembrane glutamic endopeptidase [Prochlorococcus marinus]|uniref:CPBP family intramembrane metalloprotease n=1 Tax=Prochlorococcus marinus XMU1408 TaxID=2213228 RepID=A0A318R1Q9_PROMR|nr:CPBP family intramembrane glutamic endopeptidase [Prochlorococcus marinus]MBW3042714.1 CPBP family intramembrane metalloprotease [Prochlorococcus marinus str. XMU1408]PYE01403.1 CPBP family intramembrane metalloprotease [Prochlorococcus marinus XMU1408]